MKYKKQKYRKNMMKEINVKLDFYAKKYQTQVCHIMENEPNTKLIDVTVTWYPEKRYIHDLFSFITEGKDSKIIQLKSNAAS